MEHNGAYLADYTSSSVSYILDSNPTLALSPCFSCYPLPRPGGSTNLRSCSKAAASSASGAWARHRTRARALHPRCGGVAYSSDGSLRPVPVGYL